MVSRKAKLQATKFVCDRLEDSGLFDILSRDHQEVVVRQKKELRENPGTVHVLFGNIMRRRAFVRRCNEVRSLDYHFVAPIFYKDGITAFRRLVESGKRRTPNKLHRGVLKEYGKQQIHQMLALLGPENHALSQSGKVPHLIYYQPSTLEEGGRLFESIRRFDMRLIPSDHSHLDKIFREISGDKRYVKGRVHPTEVYSTTGPVKFKAITKWGLYLTFEPEGEPIVSELSPVGEQILEAERILPEVGLSLPGNQGGPDVSYALDPRTSQGSLYFASTPGTEPTVISLEELTGRIAEQELRDPEEPGPKYQIDPKTGQGKLF